MDCLIGICASIVGKLAEIIVEPVGRQIGYFFTYTSNIVNLQSQIQELKFVKEEVDHSVHAAKNNGKPILGYVQNWLSKTEVGIAEAEKLLPSDEGESSTRCSSCSFMKRYKLSKRANKMAQAITEIRDGKKFDKVYYDPPLQVPVKLKGYEEFGSRAHTFLGIMEALRADGVGLIRAWGMGGIGKTMLVKEVARQAKGENLFSQVIMATMSQNRDYKAIQDEVAEHLGLKFYENSISLRAKRLQERLRQERNVLVILDDVWSDLDLEEVGISFSDDQRGCKIVLTSRLSDVRCDNHKGEERTFVVGVLSDSESETLFSQIVGDPMKESKFHNLGIQIVKECGGLPLAISTVAHALKNRISIPVWKNACNELAVSNPINIEGVGKNVYSSIRLSYNFLQSEEAKSLLLLCSLYKEDANIALDDLRNYGSGLSLFHGITKLEDVRNRVIHLVENLKACSLLLDGRSASFVKIHDVIRDVCISIASTDRRMYNIRNIRELNERLDNKRLENSTAVSLHCDNDDGQLPERLLCLKLKLFSLSYTRQSLLIPNQFFEGSEEIQVLCLKQVNLNCPQLSSFRFLQNLNALLLPGCQLEDVSLIGELKNLKILDLSRSHIKMVPKQLGQLTRLRSLSLYDCHNLKEIQRGVISSFFLLEELRVGRTSLINWDCKEVHYKNANVEPSELKDLGHLTMLDMGIPDPKALPNDLFTENLERYALIVGCDWIHDSSKQYSRSLHLGTMSRSVIDQSGLNFLIQRAELLEIRSLQSVRDVGNELDENGLPHLNVLIIKQDDAVRYVINSMERRVIHGCSSAAAFQNLRKLRLSELPNLEKICNGNEISMASFKKLTVIEVRKCQRLNNLFHFPTACRQLETIEVYGCMAVEEIFTYGGREEIDSNHEDAEMIEFPRLSTLVFDGLPKLTQFCREVKKINTDVEEIRSGEFPLFHELPGNSTCFQSLTSLCVRDCKSLKYLFSSSVAASLARLNQLKIENCDGIRAIIRNDQGADVKVLLPQLNYLKLSHLPNLTSFLSENNLFDNVTSLFNYEMDFPNLEMLVLSSLWQLRTIWNGNEMQIEFPGCSSATAFQNLRELCLSDLPNLEKICNGNEISTASFKKLTVIKVKTCHRLNNLFHFPTACRQLETIEVYGCMAVEEIFTYGGREEIDSNHEDAEMIEFPRLSTLVFDGLPKLTQFCREVKKINTDVGSGEFPLFHHELPGNSTCFQSITSLCVRDCKSLKYLFSSSVVASLARLNYLELSNLPNLTSFLKENILSDNVTSLFNYKMEFPNLKELVLSSLWQLETIWRDCDELTSDYICKLKYLSISKCENLTNLFTSHDQSNEEIRPQITKYSFEKLNCVTVCSCPSLKSVFPKSVAKGLLRLSSLRIEDCHELQQVIEKEEVDGTQMIDTKFVFPKLTRLWLLRLPELVSLYPGLHSLEWPSLESLDVIACGKFEITPLLSVDKVQSRNLKYIYLVLLDQLEVWSLGDRELVGNSSCKFETIYITHCINLKEVFSYETLRRLQSLRVMNISSCPNVECIFAEETPIHAEEKFDNTVPTQINYLTLDNLPKLKQVVAHNSTETTLSFLNLTHLVMSNCHGMVHFLTPSTARSMQQLTRMTISNCNRITEIIKADEGGGDRQETCEIIFSQLEVLKLEVLPNLTSFHSGSCALIFPNLTEAIVHQCDELQSFSRGAKTPRLKGIICYRNWGLDWYVGPEAWTGDINTSLQELYDSSHEVVEEEEV